MSDDHVQGPEGPTPAERKFGYAVAGAAAIAALGLLAFIALPSPSREAGPQSRPSGNTAALGSPSAMGGKYALGIYGGPGVYLEPAAGLPDAPGSATGYRFSFDGDLAATARVLAKAFGVKGEVRVDKGTGQASVGAIDGTSSYVSIYADATGSWSFYSPDASQSAYPCGLPAPMPAPASGAEPGSGGSDATVTSPDTSPAPCPSPKPRSFSDEQAIQKARAVLREIGFSDQIDLSVQKGGYDGNSVAVIGSMPGVSNEYGGSTSFTFAYDGQIMSANGYLARRVAMDGMKTVGARSAVLRVNSREWSSLGPFPVYSYPADGAVSSGVATPAAGAVAPSAGLVQVEVNSETVTSAKPTLVNYYAPDGASYLLPAYRLGTEEGNLYTVISIDESLISKVRPPAPTDGGPISAR